MIFSLYFSGFLGPWATPLSQKAIKNIIFYAFCAYVALTPVLSLVWWLALSSSFLCPIVRVPADELGRVTIKYYKFIVIIKAFTYYKFIIIKLFYCRNR